MIGRVGLVILGVIAATAALGAAMVLPVLGAHQQALKEQPRVRALVETVVASEIKAREQGGYHAISFGARDLAIALSADDRAAIIDYAVEARQVSDDRFRVQVWPRPKALNHGRAAAVSYFVDLSPTGKILDQGWAGKESDDDN